MTPSSRGARRRLLYVCNDAGFFVGYRGTAASAALAAGYEVHVATPNGAAVAEMQRRWSAELAAAAEELVTRGAASLRLDGCAVEARVVRFWRGDAVLDVSARSETWSSESRTRIPRDPRRLDRDVLVHHLANTAARS